MPFVCILVAKNIRKHQKVPKIFSTIFARHHFSRSFWGSLTRVWRKSQRSDKSQVWKESRKDVFQTFSRVSRVLGPEAPGAPMDNSCSNFKLQRFKSLQFQLLVLIYPTSNSFTGDSGLRFHWLSAISNFVIFLRFDCYLTIWASKMKKQHPRIQRAVKTWPTLSPPPPSRARKGGSFVTYSSSFFAYSGASLLTVLIGAYSTHSPTVSKEASAVSKKAPAVSSKNSDCKQKAPKSKCKQRSSTVSRKFPL